MSDRVNMFLAREVLGDDPKIFFGVDKGLSKSYLSGCLDNPILLNRAFYWAHTKQGDRYWRECYKGTIFRSEIERRLSILLPLIYEKPLALEDFI